ncbi:MAG: hypothetical protein NW215_14650 [Hyphomicrobiales bacterium]|nr:hypothetical protein [Hyphomicrobiales bacterium]
MKNGVLAGVAAACGMVNLVSVRVGIMTAPPERPSGSDQFFHKSPGTRENSATFAIYL